MRTLAVRPAPVHIKLLDGRSIGLVMRIEQCVWSAATGWQSCKVPDDPAPPRTPLPGAVMGLVWVFGDPELLTDERISELRARFPHAHLVGCSTAGEVHGTTVSDHGLVATATLFEQTTVVTRYATVSAAAESLEAGRQLAAALPSAGLRHVVVLSDGLIVNGSALAMGLVGALPSDVAVTGGLAADGARFQRTRVIGPEGAASGLVAAIGFYGEALHVSCASLGGWDPFGPERVITRAQGNVLYEMDGTSALALYRTYLGDKAKDLPGSGLLFPLAVRVGAAAPVVRTILAVDEAAGSITFAGDVPVGGVARMMKANFDRLIDGARGAARASRERLGDTTPEFALLISCVGRKLVLGQRTEEEVEGVREVVGDGAVLAGFYSYGEISPFTPGATCELHNQTMTITTFAEDVHAPAA